MISVLIIGGNRFVGKLVTDLLLKQQEVRVTLFNRGISFPEKIEGVNYIYGDRETNDIQKVLNQNWDVVIDMMGYYPDSISYFVNRLKKIAKRYVFISSVSVYDLKKSGKSILNENDCKLPFCNPEERKDNSWGTYGRRKITCEEEILNSKIDAIILRPSLIYGAYDPTDRLYYWWYRIKKEVPYVLPESLLYPVTFTYARDLASIIVETLLLDKHQTIYNVVTHPVVRFADFMEIASDVLGVSNRVNIVKDNILERKGLSDEDLPLWFKDECLVFDAARLINDFKPEFTSLTTSVKESLEWYEKKGWQIPKAGMSLEKELLLANYYGA